MTARIARGRLHSFSASAWTANVVLEGGQGEAVIPVGEWLPHKLLDSGDDVAVLLFDESNPSDGLVVGSYGTVQENLSIGARVYHNANQSINDNTVTALAFNSERWDTDTCHSTSVNNSRLTCQTAGRYLIVAQVAWAAAAGGRRAVHIELNGSGTYIAVAEESTVADATGIPRQIATTIYDLAAGDYLEVKVYQNSGGALNVTATGNYSPEFSMVRLP